MGIKLPSDGDITVGVISLDELLALVAEVRLSREISRRPLLRTAICGFDRGTESLCSRKLRVHILDL